MEGSIEIILNRYLEPIIPKSDEIKNKIDCVRDIVVFVRDENYNDYKILSIINYGTHILLKEHYESPVGEVVIERVLHYIKPSTILKILLPKIFK